MATIGTRLFTWLHGRLVGADELGNRYYTERRPPRGRRAKRWVLYASEDEASRKRIAPSFFSKVVPQS